MMKKSTVWVVALFALIGAGVFMASCAKTGSRQGASDESDKYELDPVSGSTVHDLQTLSISFPDMKGVEFKENYTNSIILENSSTGAVYTLAGADRNTRSMNPGTTFTLHFMAEGVDDVAPVIVPGTYKLTIKEGAFYYGESEENATKIQAISAEYTIDGLGYVLAPVSGEHLDKISVISINFPTSDAVEFMPEYTNSIILENLSNGRTYLLAGDPDRITKTTNPGTSFEMRFAPEGEFDAVEITEFGTYKLSMKNGAFFYNDSIKVQPIEAVYTILNN